MAYTEHNFPVNVLMPDADRYNGDPSTDIVNLGKYNRAAFIVTEGAGGTGTATITVDACDNTTPSNTSAIAFRYRVTSAIGTWGAWAAATTSGYTTVAGANKQIAIEVTSSELPDGYPYVRLTLTEVADSPVDAAVECTLSEPRYPGVSMPSPLT